MNKIIYLFLLLVCSGIAFAQISETEVVVQEVDVGSAGIGADSVFWNVDLMMEKLDLMSTINPEIKINKQIELANERLSELRDLYEQDNEYAIELTKKEYKDLIKGIKDGIEIEKDNNANVTEIENKIQAHYFNAWLLRSEILTKMSYSNQPEELKGMKLENIEQTFNDILAKIEDVNGGLKVIKERQKEV